MSLAAVRARGAAQDSDLLFLGLYDGDGALFAAHEPAELPRVAPRERLGDAAC